VLSLLLDTAATPTLNLESISHGDAQKISLNLGYILTQLSMAAAKLLIYRPSLRKKQGFPSIW
jgi:hypothetical protein